ncbi:sulfur carrier protein ThiS [Marine Group I thaumarchaeote SCGC AAA799-E16]|uniref:Sulfur carrier protein ThiS n=4 Tax=Marine Group I TaxID=905826 RepID=A0A081RNK5_9ARCH|nr:sulfur carrier protein ThiS [Marine Group I thaumarchaeote SCGC AAA799-N04]KER06288.1 sulfur carrier protein ThiS [Marine Group I thaumarchaeote SCGC AAA799-E16]KFM15486.1 sulfur carrier protein ThiS [Marine Group I thaumarchaeote SCGC AAA799-D11]KFM16728.1 sulfur carrier protein ThiS [Marine Group I thaumarchaeote SCGC RSA3]
MITVKLVGGAKKSFSTNKLEIEKSDITIAELIDLLLQLKPDDSPKLDTENVLVAVNGVDSSVMDGKSTVIKNNDVVSIIPVIHGGASKKMLYKVSSKQIQIVQIKGQKSIDVKFLDELRKKYPKTILQAVSSEFVLNGSHLKKILSLSLESQKNDVLLSNKLETDILMRFALTKQISAAIESVGIKPKTDFILVAIGNKTNLDSLYKELSSQCVSLFSKNNESFLKKSFKISKKQLDSVYSKTPLEDILVEKAAVLL